MRPPLLFALAVAAVAVGAGMWLARERSGDVPAADLLARVDAVERRLAQVARKLDDLEGDRRSVAPLAVPASASPPASPPARAELAAPASPARSAATDEHDARWYLEQWLRSFDGDEGGAEYYRLLVDAHALELVDALTALAVEPQRPLALRLAILRMLARSSLRGDPRLLTALTTILRQDAPEVIADACVRAWGKVGVKDALGQLEAVVWEIAAGNVREAALRALASVAGEGANAVYMRLFASAPDDPSAAMVLRALDGGDLAAALGVFERASRATSTAVRLVAAQRLGEFDEERFARYVDTWLGFETDPQVIAALGGARQRQATGASWSAMQAVGAPNADPGRDDPKAWAPREPQMGKQWLELTYARADRASGVRIYEVNARGAVCQVLARDDRGVWQELWSGTATAATQPLSLSFPAPTFATRTLRVVLDTDRVAGWNEIDAVEMVGAGGTQFAQRAAASSTYAQRQGAPVGGAFDGGRR